MGSNPTQGNSGTDGLSLLDDTEAVAVTVFDDLEAGAVFSFWEAYVLQLPDPFLFYYGRPSCRIIQCMCIFLASDGLLLHVSTNVR